ncbi:predicted protein [Nematostella vectensis]|uniref:Uncharacterized protein n=1 Tax=Nematostella vectensis TaxID=45351 RepID=A7SUQ2_NEMVE|nr:predicted protein [Nematostella vectensis]|eukprot:XP_001624662.1 predicted protein [Nematostella vectensis]
MIFVDFSRGSVLADLVLHTGLQALALFFVSLLALFVFAAKIKIRTPRFLVSRLPPGPWGFPVIGAAFRLGPKSHLDFLEMSRNYGQVFSMYLGSRLVVVLNGMALQEALTGKLSRVFAGRPKLYTMERCRNGGDGLINAPYCRKWKLMRKTAITAIHKYIATQDVLESILGKVAHGLVQRLDACAETPHNVMPELKFATASVILGILFGENHDASHVESILGTSDDFRKCVGCGLAVDFMPWMENFPIPKVNRMVKLTSDMNAVLKNLYEENKTSYSGRIRNLADAVIKVSEEHSQIDDDSDPKGEMADLDVVQTIVDLVGAGFDTSSLTLYWAIAYFVKYPQVQRRIHHEIDTVIGRDRIPTLDDVKHLPYTHACLYELLRVTCLAPTAVPHSTLEEVDFRGYTIPKDTVIFANIWSLLRNEEYWQNPDVFDPMRFLDEEGRLLNPNSWPTFLPFGAGIRKCTGRELAIAELMFFITAIMQKFRFSEEGLTADHPPIDLTGEAGLTLKPADYHVIITRR